jgi:hypothetical protein
MYGQAGCVLQNRSLLKEATAFAQLGLTKQTSAGINLELGGFDGNYQMVGVLFALRYLATKVTSVQDALKAMIKRAIDVELKRQLPDGSISIADSTRVGRERVGTDIKHPNYPEIFQALCIADYFMPTLAWKEAALAVARYNDLPLPASYRSSSF